jgi:hypothetical protein
MEIWFTENGPQELEKYRLYVLIICHLFYSLVTLINGTENHTN